MFSMWRYNKLFPRFGNQICLFTNLVAFLIAKPQWLFHFGKMVVNINSHPRNELSNKPTHKSTVAKAPKQSFINNKQQTY